MADDRYAALFDALTDGTLDPSCFSHRDHVGVAVVALQRLPFFDALRDVAVGLQAMARRAGAPERFRATVTLASMCLIAERLVADAAHGPPPSVDGFIDRHPELLTADALRRVYGAERLASAAARRVGLLPA